MQISVAAPVSHTGGLRGEMQERRRERERERQRREIKREKEGVEN